MDKKVVVERLDHGFLPIVLPSMSLVYGKGLNEYNVVNDQCQVNPSRYWEQPQFTTTNQRVIYENQRVYFSSNHQVVQKAIMPRGSLPKNVAKPTTKRVQKVPRDGPKSTQKNDSIYNFMEQDILDKGLEVLHKLDDTHYDSCVTKVMDIVNVRYGNAIQTDLEQFIGVETYKKIATGEIRIEDIEEYDHIWRRDFRMEDIQPQHFGSDEAEVKADMDSNMAAVPSCHVTADGKVIWKKERKKKDTVRKTTNKKVPPVTSRKNYKACVKNDPYKVEYESNQVNDKLNVSQNKCTEKIKILQDVKIDRTCVKTELGSSNESFDVDESLHSQGGKQNKLLLQNSSVTCDNDKFERWFDKFKSEDENIRDIAKNLQKSCQEFEVTKGQNSKFNETKAFSSSHSLIKPTNQKGSPKIIVCLPQKNSNQFLKKIIVPLQINTLQPLSKPCTITSKEPISSPDFTYLDEIEISKIKNIPESRSFVESVLESSNENTKFIENKNKVLLTQEMINEKLKEIIRSPSLNKTNSPRDTNVGTDKQFSEKLNLNQNTKRVSSTTEPTFRRVFSESDMSRVEKKPYTGQVFQKIDLDFDKLKDKTSGDMSPVPKQHGRSCDKLKVTPDDENQKNALKENKNDINKIENSGKSTVRYNDITVSVIKVTKKEPKSSPIKYETNGMTNKSKSGKITLHTNFNKGPKESKPGFVIDNLSASQKGHDYFKERKIETPNEIKLCLLNHKEADHVVIQKNKDIVIKEKPKTKDSLNAVRQVCLEDKNVKTSYKINFCESRCENATISDKSLTQRTDHEGYTLKNQQKKLQALNSDKNNKRFIVKQNDKDNDSFKLANSGENNKINVDEDIDCFKTTNSGENNKINVEQADKDSNNFKGFDRRYSSTETFHSCSEIVICDGQKEKCVAENLIDQDDPLKITPVKDVVASNSEKSQEVVDLTMCEEELLDSTELNTSSEDNPRPAIDKETNRKQCLVTNRSKIFGMTNDIKHENKIGNRFLSPTSGKFYDESDDEVDVEALDDQVSTPINGTINKIDDQTDSTSKNFKGGWRARKKIRQNYQGRILREKLSMTTKEILYQMHQAHLRIERIRNMVKRINFDRLNPHLDTFILRSKLTNMEALANAIRPSFQQLLKRKLPENRRKCVLKPFKVMLESGEKEEENIISQTSNEKQGKKCEKEINSISVETPVNNQRQNDLQEKDDNSTETAPSKNTDESICQRITRSTDKRLSTTSSNEDQNCQKNNNRKRSHSAEKTPNLERMRSLRRRK